MAHISWEVLQSYDCVSIERLSSTICDAEIEEMIAISDSAQPQALDGSGE